MAPLHYQIYSLKRFENIQRNFAASDSSLGVGATVGIAIGIAFVGSFALAALAHYLYTRPKRRVTQRTRRRNWTYAMENGMYGTKSMAPRTALDRVLYVFSSKRRRPNRAEQYIRSSHHVPDDDLRPRQLLDKELDVLRKPTVELEGGLGKGKAALFGAQVNRSPDPFEDAGRQVDCNRAVPPHTSAEGNKLATTMPSTTDAAAPAAWHRKRTGPPPPLTIEPPRMYSPSPSDAYSAYSTYTTARSPYEYCSINVPSVPQLASHIPSDGFGTRFPYEGADVTTHSNSNPSSQPLQCPPSPQTPGSTPSIGRSDSGAHESNPLAPPTPTYSLPRSQPSPQRTTKIEATHFECLGPLPDHILIPSPPYFRTQHQQQQDPFSTPIPHSPERRSPVGQESSTTVTSATSEMAPVFVQDPLLHETNPFRPHYSPVQPPITSEHSTHAHSLRYLDLNKTRRESTDSLGSNFTVEEEARIQAQIVRNLDALDKERVMGEMDIVHIPQVSARRYSWEQ